MIPVEGSVYEAGLITPGRRITIVEVQVFAADSYLVSYTERGMEFDLTVPAIELDAREWQAEVKRLGLRRVEGACVNELDMVPSAA